MLRLAFDFIITWRETRTRPNAYQQVFFFRFLFVGTFTEYPLFIHKRSSLFSYLAITR